MASVMPVDSSENLQLLEIWRAKTSHNCQRLLYIVAKKNKRLLINENVFLDLFAVVFEEHNLKKVA